MPQTSQQQQQVNDLSLLPETRELQTQQAKSSTTQRQEFVMTAEEEQAANEKAVGNDVCQQSTSEITETQKGDYFFRSVQTMSPSNVVPKVTMQHGDTKKTS